ncbi:hypothetical protein [Lacticaseibacillus suihuaensis]
MTPRVLLLGDSIRMGYQDVVKDELAGKADVVAPVDNGRDTTYTLYQANQLLAGDGDFDVIHWNNGYWDMNIEPPLETPLRPLPEYGYQLDRLAELLLAHCHTLLFATSLPIERSGAAVDNTGTGAEIHYDNEWVVAYNRAAKTVMAARGVAIDDLYQVALAGPHFYKGADHLHLTAAGNRVVGQAVAAAIAAAL